MCFLVCLCSVLLLVIHSCKIFQHGGFNAPLTQLKRVHATGNSQLLLGPRADLSPTGLSLASGFSLHLLQGSVL